MPKVTKTLGDSKALTWESWGLEKKEDVPILTHSRFYYLTQIHFLEQYLIATVIGPLCFSF